MWYFDIQKGMGYVFCWCSAWRGVGSIFPRHGQLEYHQWKKKSRKIFCHDDVDDCALTWATAVDFWNLFQLFLFSRMSVCLIVVGKVFFEVVLYLKLVKYFAWRASLKTDPVFFELQYKCIPFRFDQCIHSMIIYFINVFILDVIWAKRHIPEGFISIALIDYCMNRSMSLSILEIILSEAYDFRR